MKTNKTMAILLALIFNFQFIPFSYALDLGGSTQATQQPVAVKPIPSPSPSPKPAASPAPKATPSPKPVVSPKPVASPSPKPVVSPKPVASPSPKPTVSPKPVASPTPKPSPTPVASPKPAASPVPKASPAPKVTTPAATNKPSTTPKINLPKPPQPVLQNTPPNYEDIWDSLPDPIAMPLPPVEEGDSRPLIAGDTDGDGDVDLQDFSNVKTAMGTNINERTDVNADGKTDLADFNVVKSNMGNKIQTPAPPDPELDGNPYPGFDDTPRYDQKIETIETSSYFRFDYWGSTGASRYCYFSEIDLNKNGTIDIQIWYRTTNVLGSNGLPLVYAYAVSQYEDDSAAEGGARIKEAFFDTGTYDTQDQIDPMEITDFRGNADIVMRDLDRDGRFDEKTMQQTFTDPGSSDFRYHFQKVVNSVTERSIDAAKIAFLNTEPVSFQFRGWDWYSEASKPNYFPFIKAPSTFSQTGYLPEQVTIDGRTYTVVFEHTEEVLKDVDLGELKFVKYDYIYDSQHLPEQHKPTEYYLWGNPISSEDLVNRIREIFTNLGEEVDEIQAVLADDHNNFTASGVKLKIDRLDAIYLQTTHIVNFIQMSRDTERIEVQNPVGAKIVRAWQTIPEHTENEEVIEYLNKGPKTRLLDKLYKNNRPPLNSAPNN